jgi:thiamine-monophosphate kinase
MAAVPVGVLVSCGLAPEDVRGSVAGDLHRGVEEAARRVGAAVVGGDLSRSPGPLFLDVVAVGRAEDPILRDGARVGDELWVTGGLGAAGAAVRALGAGRAPPPRVRTAYARPVSRVGEALWLAERGVLHALIDVSDGLAADAGHLASASGVGIVLEADRVPVDPRARLLAGDERDALDLALSAGEDYELCFAAPPGAVEELSASFQAHFAVPLARVGQVVEGQGIYLDRGDGEPVPLRGGGYDHFAVGPGG